MASYDFRDAVIEDLAASEVLLREQVADLAERAVRAEVDLDAMRLVAVAGLHHAHDLQVELNDLRERYNRALREAHDLRANTIHKDAAHRAA